MQVSIHLGAHATDEDRLLRSILQNKGKLAAHGIAVPGPGRYRDLVVKSIQRLRGKPATAEAQSELIDAVLDGETADRLLLSFENFICVPGRVFELGVFYEKAEYKPTWLRNLFADHEVEFHIGIRNPATFIPAILEHPQQTHGSLAALLQGCNPTDARWSEVIIAIKETNPDCRLTVWCNEDTPFIWTEIMRAFAGLGDETGPLEGELSILATIMRPEGLERLQDYLRETPPATDKMRHRVLATFLERYAIEDEIEEELDLPGWSGSLVDELTDAYEADIMDIAGIEGVRFLTP